MCCAITFTYETGWAMIVVVFRPPSFLAMFSQGWKQTTKKEAFQVFGSLCHCVLMRSLSLLFYCMKFFGVGCQCLCIPGTLLEKGPF